MVRKLRKSGVLAFCALLPLSCFGGGPSGPAASWPGLPLPAFPDSLPHPPYIDPDLPLDTRVEDLLGRMTLEEKVAQTLYDAPAIERLGIPEYNWWNEALHGVARAGRATVFPQAIGLGATFDPEMMFGVAAAISDEARAKHHESARRGSRGIYEGLTFWSPNINIFRDPRWGRGMETYGEDPFLSGRMAVAFVQGMQGSDSVYLKTVATPKHYAVHSGPEPDRHTFDARVDERDLRQTYLPAFQAAVVEAGAESVMCAYNRFRGDPACASPVLLQDILRDEWGFDGYVVSDCWAISDIYRTHRTVGTAPRAAALSMATGTDLNCGVTFDSLSAAIGQGLLTESQLDESVRRLLSARFRLGMFDPPDRVAYAQIPLSVVDSEEHQALALEATRKSLVLLKNEGNLLPLRKDLGTIAVIGPNADDLGVLLGNYNGFPSDPVTPLRGIRERVSNRTEILFSRGSSLAPHLPYLEVIPTAALRPGTEEEAAIGLLGEYFANDSLFGSPVATSRDGTVDFQWFEEVPADSLTPGDFSVRWTGTFLPPISGEFIMGVRALGELTLFVDGEQVAAARGTHEPNTHWAEMEFEGGVRHTIRLEFRAVRTGALAQLVWDRPEPGLRRDAIWAAERADAVVMFMGLSPQLEGEEMQVEIPGYQGGDRVHLGLPSPQQSLLEAVVATGTPVVLVLLNGSALAIPWAAENVDAIVEAWYPGQAGGTAIADVLFGDYNPGGRLPVTFYGGAEDLPPFDDYDMDGRTYRYFGGDPVFPFGHGLSYTTFSYEDMIMQGPVWEGDEFKVTVAVRNTGPVTGEEVVQLYVSDLQASVPVPQRTLAGVKRILLRPGERNTVAFTLTPEHLSLVDTGGRWIVEPGVFELSIGGKQPGFSGVADAETTEVLRARFRVLDDTFRRD